MRINENVVKVIYIILLIGSFLSLSYIIALQLKSSLILGIVIYLLEITLYMLINMGIGVAYQLAWMAKHPLPGFFSLLTGHLTQMQLENLNQQFGSLGNTMAVMYEFLLMRMDIIIPSGIIFFLLITTTFPSIAYNTTNAIMLGILFSIFALSYLIYTILSAYFYAIRVTSSTATTVAINAEDLINATLMAAT